jgi:hypothetical protein
MNKTQWTWSICEWDTLSDSLAEMDAQGWEVFTIVNTDTVKHCRVVYKKSPIENPIPKKEKKEDAATDLHVQRAVFRRPKRY